MTRGDFGGWGFALGSVRGVRSWEVTPDGHLTGVTFHSRWPAGEAQAECHPPTTVSPLMAMGGTLTRLGRALGVEHDPAECSCGFYAYYSAADNPYQVYRRPGAISGVIEGYGQTVLGGKGFRAQKARILALCIPGIEPGPQFKRRWWLAQLVWCLTFALWDLCRLVWGSGTIVPAISLTVLTACGWSAAWHLMDIRRANRVHTSDVCESVLHEIGYCLRPNRRWWQQKRMSRRERIAIRAQPALASHRLVRANYPDVPIFTSDESMLAAYPVSRPSLPALDREATS